MIQHELPLVPERITLKYVERLLKEQTDYIVTEKQGIVGVSDAAKSCPIANLLNRAGFTHVEVLGETTTFRADFLEETWRDNSPEVQALIDKVDSCEDVHKPVTLEDFVAMIDYVRAEASL